MVWIHGGGLNTGGNSEFRLRGEHMSMMGDVIVVNINYRLGTLGWLAHPAFATEDPEFPSSGNYGYLDQRQALLWVQDNIHLFGGDPMKVTIMGESAGGSSVCFHVAGKKSWGLFSQGIAESGACFEETSTLEESQEFAMLFQSSLNCKGDNQQVIECMRAASAQQILDLHKNASLDSAVIDGFIFVEHPYVAFTNGRAAQVPLIFGNVRDEATAFLNLPRPIDNAGYEQLLKDRVSDFYSQVIQEYPCDAYNASDCWYALCAALADYTFICPTQKIATALASSVPTYSYEFSHVPTWAKMPDLGVFHSSEIAFVFSTLMDIYTYTEEEATLAHQMTYFWTSFGKSGNPNSDNVPFTWPLWNRSQGNRIVLDLTLNITSGYKTEKCQFWEGIYKVMFS